MLLDKHKLAANGARLTRMFVTWCMVIILLLTVLLCAGGLSIFRNTMYAQFFNLVNTVLRINADKYNVEELKEDIKTGTMGLTLIEGLEDTVTIRDHSDITYMYMLYFPDKNNATDMRYVFYSLTQAEKNQGYEPSYVGMPCGSEYDASLYTAVYNAMFSLDTAKRSGYVVNRTGGENAFGIAEMMEMMTGYYALVDAEGKPVAVLCAEVQISLIRQQLHKYTVMTISVGVVLFLISSLGLVTIIRNDIINPVVSLAQSSEDFIEQAERTKDPSELVYRPVTVRRNTEIKDLSEGMVVMTDALKGYMNNLQKVTAEKERIGAELDVATHIQASMLPCVFPPFPDRDEFEIYATMTPAKEVGGDFYDFFMVDKRHLAIVMADVSGKGVPAALFMVIGKTLIKDHTTPGTDLGEVFSSVNNLLCESNSEGLFITAFEGVLDLITGELRYVNAGHEMPFIYKKGGDFMPQKIKAGFVLAGMEDMRYRAGSMMLEPGDKVFQYTDGVTEATNAKKQLFGMERLAAALNQVKEQGTEDILRGVKVAVDTFVGEAPQFDDITMLCLEYKKRMEETK